MSKKTDSILNEEEGIKNEAVVETEAANAPEEPETGSIVYCGPSIRNVARQFTVYAGPLPAALREFIDKHPAAAGLLVPVEKFAETRRKLEIKGTAEAVLYNTVKAEI